MLSAVVRVASRSGSVRCAASLQAEEVLALFHPSYVQTKDSALQGAVDKYTAALAAAGLNKAGTSASALAAFASKFAASNPDAASLLLQAPVRVSQADASRRKMIESGDQYLRDVQYVWDALASSSNGGEVSLAAFAEWAERNAEVKKALRRIRDVTPFQSPNDASMRKKPVRVAVTGGAGAIGYSLLFRIASGEMLGAQQPVHLSIIDLPDALPKLKGTIMELEDCAFPLLAGVTGTADLNEGFQDAKFAMLVGARPRSKGMERADLMAANAAIFAEQGKALNAVAHPTVKVLVVGNPANTNALIAKANAPNLDPANFTAMTRLDQNRAISMLAKKLGCAVDDIDRFALWGNHSPTMYPDVSHASVKGEWVKPKVDQTWYVNEFIPRVGKRGAEILEARGASSAASAASAAIDHMRDWHLGSDGRWVSMGVPSDGSYGIDEGIIYSVPVVCEGGEYKRVHGLPIDEFSAERMEITRKELESEKDLIKHLLPTSSATVSVGDKKKKLVETQDPAERDRLYGELKSEAAKKGK